MGNRAVITSKRDLSGVGIYLHWNGGPDSVETFLEYCSLKGYAPPDRDCYGWARLAQVIGNFFGGGLSVGIDIARTLDTDNGDNGTYIIEGWKVKKRLFRHGGREGYDRAELLKQIDAAQPEKERIADYFTAEEIPVEELKIGDVVVFRDSLDEIIKKCPVIGFGPAGYTNGYNTEGKPYVDRWGRGAEDAARNCNNYPGCPGVMGTDGKTVRVIRKKEG